MTTAISHAATAQESLAALHEASGHLAGVHCDHLGCPSVFGGSPYTAAAEGWRHDAIGLLFYCPACTPAGGWPPPPAPGGGLDIPAGLYQAWADGDPSPLTTWMDKELGPAAAGQEAACSTT